MRRLYWLIFIVTLMFGASYASALLNGLMGPWSAVGIEQDGSRTTMQFGQALPHPAWVPVYPGASVVQASRLVSTQALSGFHSLDLATRASLEEIKRFYMTELAAAGFAVEDQGIAPLNPAKKSAMQFAMNVRAQLLPRANLSSRQPRAHQSLMRFLRAATRRRAARLESAPLKGRRLGARLLLLKASTQRARHDRRRAAPQ